MQFYINFALQCKYFNFLRITVILQNSVNSVYVYFQDYMKVIENKCKWEATSAGPQGYINISIHVHVGLHKNYLIFSSYLTIRLRARVFYEQTIACRKRGRVA